MEEKIQIDHYGLIGSHGVVYLHQQDSEEAWEYDLESPFYTKVRATTGNCPHAFQKDHGNEFDRVKDPKMIERNPLLAKLVPNAPTSSPRVTLVPAGTFPESFAKLCQFNGNLNFPLAYYSGASRIVTTIEKQLKLTNLTPLMISQFEMKDYKFIDQLVRMTSNERRPVVCFVPELFPPMMFVDFIEPGMMSEVEHWIERQPKNLDWVKAGSHYLESIVFPKVAENE